MTASVPGESKRSVEARSGKSRFPRSGRLLRHADFERVYKLGRRHFSASMTVFYLRRPEAAVQETSPARDSQDDKYSELRVGFTVGRALGGAVERNRMKRRLREAVRLTRPADGAKVDVVINPKKSLLTAEFDAVLNEVRRAFDAIEKKLSPSLKDESGRDASTPG